MNTSFLANQMKPGDNGFVYDVAWQLQVVGCRFRMWSTLKMGCFMG